MIFRFLDGIGISREVGSEIRGLMLNMKRPSVVELTSKELEYLKIHPDYISQISKVLTF